MGIRIPISKDNSVESFNKAVHAINVGVTESKKELDEISNFEIPKLDILQDRLQRIEKIMYICAVLVDNYGKERPWTFRDL